MELVINVAAVAVAALFLAYFAIDGVLNENTFQLGAYLLLSMMLLFRVVGAFWFAYDGLSGTMHATYVVGIVITGMTTITWCLH